GCPQLHLVLVFAQQIKIAAHQRGPRLNADAMARLEQEFEDLPRHQQFLLQWLIGVAQKRYQDATLPPGSLHRPRRCEGAQLVLQSFYQTNACAIETAPVRLRLPLPERLRFDAWLSG